MRSAGIGRSLEAVKRVLDRLAVSLLEPSFMLGLRRLSGDVVEPLHSEHSLEEHTYKVRVTDVSNSKPDECGLIQNELIKIGNGELDSLLIQRLHFTGSYQCVINPDDLEHFGSTSDTFKLFTFSSGFKNILVKKTAK